MKGVATGPAPPRRSEGHDAAFKLTLPFVPPFDWDAALRFVASRAVPGVEIVSEGRYARTLACEDRSGWIMVQPAGARADALAVRISGSLKEARDSVAARVRALFDVDTDPRSVNAHLASFPELGPLVRRRPGLRVPGAIDGFELALRAIVGQQVTVRGASRLAARIVAAFGTPIRTGQPGLDRLAVPAARLAQVDPGDVAALGMPGARAACIVGLARLVAAGDVRLEPGVEPEAAIRQLLGVPGIGPWTAHYVAMRALRWPDAFPHGDLGLRKALGGVTADRLRRAADPWRPWRACAAIHLWQSLSDS